jgi:hypothetical protein
MDAASLTWLFRFGFSGWSTHMSNKDKQRLSDKLDKSLNRSAGAAQLIFGVPWNKIWEFIKKLAWPTVWATGGSAVTAIWNYFKDVPAPIIFTVSIVAFAGILAAILLLAKIVEIVKGKFAKHEGNLLSMTAEEDSRSVAKGAACSIRVRNDSPTESLEVSVDITGIQPAIDGMVLPWSLKIATAGDCRVVRLDPENTALVDIATHNVLTHQLFIGDAIVDCSRNTKFSMEICAHGPAFSLKRKFIVERYGMIARIRADE